MMHNYIMTEFKKNPILYGFMTIISLSITTTSGILIKETWASKDYVDDKIKTTKLYVDTKHNSALQVLQDIKRSVDRMDDRVFELYKGRKK